MFICCFIHQHIVVLSVGKELPLVIWPHFSSSFVIWFWLKSVSVLAGRQMLTKRSHFLPWHSWPGHTTLLFTMASLCLFSTVACANPCPLFYQLSFVIRLILT